MDYEKAYKEALERARKLWSEAKANEYTSDIEDYETIFPELAESKDEKIRKEMIEHFKSKTKETWCNIPVKDIIAYLEKQKEQKPAWSEEDEDMRKKAIEYITLYSDEYGDYNEIIRVLSWLKSLRPPQYCENCRLKKSVQDWKPSEEQMKALQRASTNEYLSAKQFDILVSLYEQLKKLV